MIIAYWKLVYSSGEILKSHRIYATKGRAYRYLQPFLIRHYVAPRWEHGVECIEYHVSLRDVFTDPEPRGFYDWAAFGSRLFHPIPVPEHYILVDYNSSYPSKLEVHK